jgi:hypothetical protein
MKPDWDPLGYALDLPLRETFFPLGFAVELETNSPAILAAAGRSWSAESRRDDSKPIVLRAAISDGAPPAAQPTHRGCGALLAVVIDSSNFAVADLDAGLASCWATNAALSDPLQFARTFLDGLVYQILCRRKLTPVHASCVALGRRGILFHGPSGAGKSIVAYACAKAGFDFVSDDVTYLTRDSRPLALGRRKFLRLKRGAEKLFPALEPIEDLAELETEADLGLSTAPSCDPAAVVILQRGAATNLAPLRPETALDSLIGDLPFSDDYVIAEQVESLRTLVNRGAWRLRYNDLATAVEAIQSQIPL